MPKAACIPRRRGETLGLVQTTIGLFKKRPARKTGENRVHRHVAGIHAAYVVHVEASEHLLLTVFKGCEQPLHRFGGRAIVAAHEFLRELRHVAVGIFRHFQEQPILHQPETARKRRLRLGEIPRNPAVAAETHFFGNVAAAFHHRIKSARILSPVAPDRFLRGKTVPLLKYVAVVGVSHQRSEHERAAEAHLHVVARADRLRRQFRVRISESADRDFRMDLADDVGNGVHKVDVRPRPRTFALGKFNTFLAMAVAAVAVVLRKLIYARIGVFATGGHFLLPVGGDVAEHLFGDEAAHFLLRHAEIALVDLPFGIDRAERIVLYCRLGVMGERMAGEWPADAHSRRERDAERLLVAQTPVVVHIIGGDEHLPVENRRSSGYIKFRKTPL